MSSIWAHALATVVVQGTPPAPPVIFAPPTQRLQRWMPGDARCGDTILPSAQIRRPYVALQWGTTTAAPRVYRFRIDATGRPYSISIDPLTSDGSTGDIAPSLAASRFAVTRALGDCQVTYTADPMSLDEAPVGDLISYSLNPVSGRLPEAAWARIRPVGADCAKAPRPQWLRSVLPDYLKLPGEPGARHWTLLAYDLDTSGRPRGITVVTGTQSRALDRAATVALSDSRQTQGPRQGCLQPFVRYATRLAAPTDVDLESFRPAGATCPRETPWGTRPVLSYPDTWRKRAIEGWAIVTFDVAPWGGIGNTKAVAAEPSGEFGAAATRIIGTATIATSSTGYTGCVERVRFVMGPGTPDAAEDAGADG